MLSESKNIKTTFFKHYKKMFEDPSLMFDTYNACTKENIVLINKTSHLFSYDVIAKCLGVSEQRIKNILNEKSKIQSQKRIADRKKRSTKTNG